VRIKCIKNKTLSEEPFYSELGKIYIVYAFGIFREYFKYCICDESYSFYPLWNPANFFEIIDGCCSRYWLVGLREDNNEKIPFLSFPEWANNPYFYGELVDGNKNDTNAIIFRKYKALMDLEFPDPSITEKAEIGDRDWLICPKCIDAWEWKDDRDALVKCPKCRTIFNNPRYKNEYPHLNIRI